MKTIAIALAFTAIGYGGHVAYLAWINPDCAVIIADDVIIEGATTIMVGNHKTAICVQPKV